MGESPAPLPRLGALLYMFPFGVFGVIHGDRPIMSNEFIDFGRLWVRVVMV